MTASGRGRRPEPRIVDLATHPRDRVCLAVAAEYLGISYRTVQARIEAGALAGVRDGRRWLVDVEALRKYAKARAVTS